MSVGTISEAQRELIEKIEHQSGIKFQGRSKKDAVLFVQSHIKKLDRKQGVTATMRQKDHCKCICKLLDLTFDPKTRTEATKFIEEHSFNAVIEAERIIKGSGDGNLVSRYEKIKDRKSAVAQLAVAYLRVNDYGLHGC